MFGVLRHVLSGERVGYFLFQERGFCVALGRASAGERLEKLGGWPASYREAYLGCLADC